MAEALTAPLLVAAAVLAVAGIAKLRTPTGAVRALGVLGIDVSAAAIRVFAVCELALAGWVALQPSRIPGAILAALYGAFSLLTLLLARRRASCGCFGETSAPASVAQSLLSLALAAVALAATLAGAHGLDWALDRSVASAAVLIVGTAAAAYGTVVAYSELPLAWASWSGR